jgi:hypothetical protein
VRVALVSAAAILCAELRQNYSLVDPGLKPLFVLMIFSGLKPTAHSGRTGARAGFVGERVGGVECGDAKPRSQKLDVGQPSSSAISDVGHPPDPLTYEELVA